MEFLSQPTSWVFFSFVIFAVLFARFGWKDVAAKLDGRINEIRDELNAAQKLKTEAASMLEEYRQRHRDALKEAAEINARAKAQAETLHAKALADLAETMARREKQLQDRLSRIEASAEAEMRKATAELALKASRDLIAKNLDQNALIDKSIAGLPGSLN